MRIARFVSLALLGVLAWSGCNAIFGIGPGQSGSGTGGAGECPPAKAATCDPEHVDDSANCCTAGRDCEDGECVAQECTAHRIVDADGAGCVSIAVAGDRLVWTRGGDLGLYVSDVDGGQKGTFAIPMDVPNQGTARVTVDTGVTPPIAYFTDYLGTTVGRTPVDDQDVEVFAAIPSGEANQARYGNILVHAGYVYWAMQLEDSDPTSGKDIWRAKIGPMGSAAATAERVVASDHPLGLATDDAYLYFDDSAKGTLERIPWSALADGASLPAASETLATDAAEYMGAEIGEMAVDDTYIYWGTGHTLFAMPKATPNGQRKTIGTVSGLLGIVLVDGRDIYYSTLGFGGPSELYRAPKGGVGGYPKKLYETGDDNAHITSIAQDCGHVYVLVGSGCDVYKITK
ncbi:MAG: hypothetical protein U0441_20695 [Polyangiaceae bacterium]